MQLADNVQHAKVATFFSRLNLNLANIINPTHWPQGSFPIHTNPEVLHFGYLLNPFEAL